MAYRAELLLRREAIAKAFGDPDAVKSFEDQQALLAGHPDEIKQAQDTATDAKTKVDDIKANARFLVLALTGSLSQERRLVGGLGVDITDGGPNADATITVDVIEILGFTPADVAGDTFTGPIAAPEVQADTLKLGATGLTATATASDYSLPVDIGGTTYYLRLSSTP